jgi:hypothetical protein
LLVPAAALGLSACALPQPEQERATSTELRVTRDFGRERLESVSIPRLASGQTVLALLESEMRVDPGASGTSVRAIAGLPERADARWSYYVNGLRSRIPPARRGVAAGDVIQWDRHRAGADGAVSAIVGAYPEPFLAGFAGERTPVRVDCDDDRSRACTTVKDRLRADGVVASGGRVGTGAGPEVIRVVVAPWGVARIAEAALVLEQGPQRSGVFARFTDGGSTLQLLDETGRPAREAPPGTGLIAASTPRTQGPVWIVTGVDRAGLDRAAATLGRAALRDAFAVAVTPAGPVRLPVPPRR